MTKRARSRNEQEKFERREALLNAAQRIFFTKGFENTSMDDIASEAGVSRGLLYVYFKDKKDIYRSLRVRSVETLHHHLSNGVDLATKGIDQVAQIGEAFYGFYRTEKKHFDCLSLDISLNNQNSSMKQEAKDDPEAMKIEHSTMKIMVNALQTGIEDGSIDSNKVPDLLQTAMFLRGCLHGVILLQDQDGSALLDQQGIDKNELVMFSIRQVTDSIRRL